jgi:transposase InsO family protein
MSLHRNAKLGLGGRYALVRARALPQWLKHYNTRRPRSSLGDRPPDQPRSQPV